MTIGFPSSLHKKESPPDTMSKPAEQGDAASAACTTKILCKQQTLDTDRVTSNTSFNDNSTSDEQQPESSKLQLLPQPTSATNLNSTTTGCNANISGVLSLTADDTTTVAIDDVQTLPDEFAKKLVAQIQRRLDQFLSNSPYIRTNTAVNELPRFTPNHLNLGRTIAKGGFSNIIELNSFNKEDCVLRPASSEDEEEGAVTKTERGEYVIKCLSTKLALKKLPGATKDIVFEAHTLASLKHDNIIRLRGWSHDGIEGFQTSLRPDGFFLILDRLEDTLFQRVFQWQHELKGKGKYNTTKKKISRAKIARHQFHEKIQIAIDVANALTYCHSKRIIHRDIKSANVAFDRTGSAKLIDFGLAIEIAPHLPQNPHRTFELTGNIGTARYMSPEVILERPYNEKSDVHSFAVLCWEACAAKKPYASLDAKNVKEHVSKWGARPKPYWSWPRRLRKILKKGWTRRQEERPTMAEFHKTLLKVQASLPKSSIDFHQTN